MMHVTVFLRLYGAFNFNWDDVHSVELKDELDCYNAKCYRSDYSVLSEFSFILHDSKYVLHGVYTQYNLRGLPQTTKYYKYDKLHNEEGPAYYHWGYDGTLTTKGYCIDGKLHREDGPARYMYYNFGLKLTEETWFHHGESYVQEFTKRAL